MVAVGRRRSSSRRTSPAPGVSTAPIEHVCTATGETPSTGLRRQSMSKAYEALPSAARVASAVAVRSRAWGSPAIATADWLRWRASTAPRSSSAHAVTRRTGRPSRASATATLAALPPAYSTEVPSARCTMSTSDSPTTSTSVMAPSWRIDVRRHVVQTNQARKVHDAPMTIVADPATAPSAPAPRTRPTDVLVAALLVAAELVLGWFSYDLARAWSHHVSSLRPVQWFFLML